MAKCTIKYKGKTISEEDFVKEMEGRLPRGLSKRMSGSEATNLIQGDIENNPSHTYEVQHEADVNEKLAQMTEQDKIDKLSEVDRNDVFKSGEKGDNNAVAAGISLYNQYIAEGNVDKATATFTRLSELGTGLGQLIQQYTRLKNATPDGVVDLVNRAVEAKGRKLTTEQKARLREASKNEMEARGELNKAEVRANEDYSNENKQELDNARENYGVVAKELDKVNYDYNVDTGGELITAIMQGNLLTPMSQMANIVGNLSKAGVSGVARQIAIPIDKTISSLTGRERGLEFDMGRTVAYAKGAGKGLIQGVKQIISGPESEYITGEYKKRMRPIRALQQSISKDLMPVDPKTGKIKTSDRINKAIEGVFGIPAEATFRALNAMDLMFKGGTKEATLHELGKKEGLSGSGLEKFLDLPPKDAEDLANHMADVATYQNKTETSDLAVKYVGLAINSINKIKQPLLRESLKFGVKTQVPFVKTPANYLSDLSDYTIPAKSLYKAHKALTEKIELTTYEKSTLSKEEQVQRLKYKAIKAQRTASTMIATALTGAMMLGGAFKLNELGVIKGDEKKEKKDKDLSYLTQPPNTINVSALQRYKKTGNKEDTKYQPGDKCHSYTKYGVTGGIMSIVSNAYKEGEKVTDATMGDIFQGAAGGTLNAMLEQSFASGANTLIDAIGKGNYDKWGENLAASTSSVVLPNTLRSLNATTTENMKDMTKLEFWPKVYETLQQKLHPLTENNAPNRINMWGGITPNTPKGSNKIQYNWLDIGRTQRQHPDELTMEVYRLTNETGNSDAIPSAPRQIIKFQDNEITLDAYDYETLLKEVGKTRAKEAKLLIQSTDYNNSTQEEKVDMLRNVYSTASQMVVDQFATPKLIKKYQAKEKKDKKK